MSKFLTTVTIIVIGLTLTLSACIKKDEKSIRELTSQEKRNLSFIENAPAVKEDKIPQNPLYQSCFNEICKDALSFEAPPTSAAISTYIQHIEKLNNNGFLVEKQRNSTILNKIDHLDKEKVSLSEQESSLFLALISLIRIPEVTDYTKMNTKSLNYEIDREKYFNSKSQNSFPLTEDMLDLIESLFNSPWNKLKRLDIPIWEILKDPATDSGNVKEKIKQLVLFTIATDKKFNSFLGLPSLISNSLRKALDGKELTLMDSQILLNALLRAEFYYEVLDGKYKNLAKNTKFNYKLYFKKVLSESPQRIARYIEENTEKQYRSCIEKYKKALIAAPIDSEIALAKETIKKIRHLAIEEVENLAVSAEKKKEIQKNLIEAQLSFPDNQENIFNTIKNDIEHQIELIKMTKVSEFTDQTTYLFALSAALQIEKSQNNSNSTEDENCTSYDNLDKFTDRVLTSTNKIFISAMALRNKFSLASVFSHELGHIVFKTMTGSDDFPKKMEDLISFQSPILTCEADQLKNEIKYLNESFSDSFSAKITKSYLQNNNSKNANSNCNFIANYKISLSFKNTDNTDTHPSYFFRTLNWQKNFDGTLPKSCQQLLNEAGYGSIKTCW